MTNVLEAPRHSRPPPGEGARLLVEILPVSAALRIADCGIEKPNVSHMQLRLGLTARITALFVVLAATLLIAVVVLVYRNGRTVIESAAIAELVGLAHEKEAAIRAWGAERVSGISQTDLSWSRRCKRVRTTTS